MTDARNKGRIPRFMKAKKPLRSPRKISLIEALKEKYCSADDDLENNAGIVIEFVSKPKNDSSAELGYLRNVVLDNCNLSHIGAPPSGLASICPNIVDLDLSNNHLTCGDCLTLLSQLHRVKFFNISGNPLINCQSALHKWEKSLPNVENLVMNRTGIHWNDAMDLCSHLPALKELHICDNGYTKIELPNTCSLEGLACLRINGNKITRWEEIWKLHSLSQLESLVMSNNPLENVFYAKAKSNRPVNEQEARECNKLISEIEDFLSVITDTATDRVTEQFQKKLRLNSLGEESLSGQSDNETSVQCDSCACLHEEMEPEEITPFQSLAVLCVSETKLGNWEHLEALSEFPSLTNVRLKGIQLADNISEEERRKLFVASLPSIKHLNGSEITSTERDKAERHFIRHFNEKDHKPETFHELQRKHGKMQQLVDVDIGFGFQEWAELDLMYDGQVVQQITVHVVEPVGRLRIFISKAIGLPLRSFQIIHNPCGDGHLPEYRHGEEPQLAELRLDSLPMSRYNFMDGDQIIVVDR